MRIKLPDHTETIRPGKILGIGRNYAAHAREMSAEPALEPVIFLMPSTALIPTGGVVRMPKRSSNVHYEAELVAVIGRETRDVAPADALDAVCAYALGLDMTARDLQAVAKGKGQPWSVAKGFDTSAPLGPLVASSDIDDPQSIEFRLTVNSELRQVGHTADMINDVAHLVSYCSAVFTLEPGDLIFTGTPEGVGSVEPGDTLTVSAGGFEPLTVTVE